MPETPKKPSKTAIERSQRSEATQVTPKPRKKPGPPKGSGGKASTYCPIIAQQMCEQLSEGIPLREICRQPGFPAWRTVYDWMVKDADLSAAIAKARDVGYDAIAEECLAIADDASNDWMERLDEKGIPIGWKLNGEHVQRSKLRIETRLKLLAKFNPKRYGDRVQLAGDSENPLKVDQTVEVRSMFDAILQNMELKRQSEANE